MPIVYAKQLSYSELISIWKALQVWRNFCQFKKIKQINYLKTIYSQNVKDPGSRWFMGLYVAQFCIDFTS